MGPRSALGGSERVFLLARCPLYSGQLPLPWERAIINQIASQKTLHEETPLLDLGGQNAKRLNARGEAGKDGAAL